MNPIAITANGMPTPIPIFAPFESLCGLEGAVDELEDEDVNCFEVEDCCDEIVDVPASAGKSELCHHTGMPDPNILYSPVTVVKLAKLVEYQTVLSRIGEIQVKVVVEEAGTTDLQL